ncbi:adenylate/guanylate cyclase domain-containing protein, partial [Nocardia tengchongensis]|uniref:adenylate/guanylate cyclase domain-containing protein n=1 Tax=Nocardia tengchongensis TaxID=2055889 RepID=UPI0036978997
NPTPHHTHPPARVLNKTPHATTSITPPPTPPPPPPHPRHSTPPLARAAQTISEMPQIRVGLAYGPVLTRFGDLYGTVVNVAARLTGVARPGTVLADDGAAAILDADTDLTLRHLRSVRVKGISRLRSHVVRERKRR